jgi:hypothetical protein
MNNNISELIAQMTAVGMAASDNVIGCTEKEIAQLESTYAVILPASYKDFLKKMGAGAGYFLHGSKLYYPELITLKKSAEQLLKDNDNPFTLGKEQFVFLNHQDYQFMFIDTTSGDDPPVCRYVEGQTGPEEVDKHFSSWLRRCISDECKLFEETKAIKAELGLTL